MKTQYFKLNLYQLRCLEKPERWSESEPYIWNVFFKVDGDTVYLTDTFLLEGEPEFHYSEGSHGNLGAGSVKAGDVIVIPEQVGLWRSSLKPIRVPFFESPISGLVGVVCVLMEQNYVSSKGAEAGHQALNAFVRESITQAIRDFDPKKVDLSDIDGSIKKYLDSSVKRYTETIGELVGQAVQKSQSMLENMYSLLKKDALIGYKVFDFSNAGIKEKDGRIEFKHKFETKRDGEWELRGMISARTDPNYLNAIKPRPEGEEE